MPKMRPAGGSAQPAAKSKPKVKIRSRRRAPLAAAVVALLGTALRLATALVLVLAQLASTLQQPTASELSLEYLDLRQVPSDQLCKFQSRNQLVNSLSLANNQISAIESGAFVCVALRLKILSIRNNKIETISDEAFKGLGQLQVLLLDGNKLIKLPSKQLAASNLPALHHLNLANNRISSIEAADRLSGPNLISLNVRGNPIEFFDAEALSGLTRLKTLTLADWQLKTNHFGPLDGLTELSFVHLDELGAHLNSIDEQLCQSSRKLATLSLKWNQFELVPRLASCVGLLSLDLSYNKIQGHLGGNFSQLTNLIDLYLGHNQLEFLEADAFVGLSRLQVLELNSNKIKRIHPAAFIPVRETLYELDVAHNVHLEELTANGLERLLSLKAHGNRQLRRLPAELPSVRMLALTFAYHCCDYCQEGEASQLGAGNWSAFRQIPTTSHNGDEPLGDPKSSRQQETKNEADEMALRQQKQQQQRGPGHSLVARWSDSILSKLAQIWSRNESASTEVRSTPPEEAANSGNMSELVIWRPAVGGVAVQSARGRQRRDEPANLVVGDHPNYSRHHHDDEYHSEAARNLHPNTRTPTRRPELSEMETCATCANVIDELDRIRLAHSAGGEAPSEIVAVEPISGHVDDVCNDHQQLSLDSRAILVADKLAARLLTTVSRNDVDWERSRPASRGPNKRDTNMETRRQTPVRCLPQPNAFQPCRDLFDSIWLRASIWLVFLFGFAGNVLVIVVLSSVRPSSSTSALTSIMWFNAAQSKRHIDVPRFLVINLAVADLLMALYLGLLAFIDLSTLGEFRQHAIKWQYSTGCQLAGFLAVLSSELSVFILAVITLERNYAITNAVHLNRRLSLQKAIGIMFLGYVYALTMAILPLNGKINDYRKFSICLPLDFDANNLQSSSSLYLISLITINTLSFVLLLSCYLRMYCAIRGSQAWSTNDLKIAKRMSILVVTDFLCWSPIILVASLALFGHYLVGSEGLKVLIIFVLPLNSVANPFLYAITTKKFKRDLAALRKRLKLERPLAVMTRLVQIAGCSRRRDSIVSQQANSLNGLRYQRAPGGRQQQQQQQQRSQTGKIKRAPPTGCAVALDETRTAVSSKIQRARQELLLVNEDGHSILAQGIHLTNRAHRRIQFEPMPMANQSASAGACEKSTELRVRRCAVCRSRLTATDGFDSSSTSAEFLARRPEEGRPKIVLDSVEPVLDVALAPLQLAAAESQNGRPKLLTPLQSANGSLVLCRQNSISDLEEVQLVRTQASTVEEHQVCAGSPEDQNQLAQDFLLPLASTDKNHSSRADTSPETHHNASSDNDPYQQTSSCLTVLINDHHLRQASNKTLASYPKASPDEFRSVSACGYIWPVPSSGHQARNSGESNGSHLVVTSGVCCSCSSEIVQVDRKATDSQRGHTTSPEVRTRSAAVSRLHSSNSRHQNQARARTRSISRFVIEPLAKAWSSLQLSFQPSQATATTTNTSSQHSATLKIPNFQVAKSTAVVALPNQHSATGQTFVIRDIKNDNENSHSTGRDELLVDVNESDIIEDVLQMSSPKRRLMLRGRRMSRSCDVIVETSTTSTSGEPTSSGYYDQNNDQRILLATISQLNSRSWKGCAKQMSFDQHNPRHAAQQVSGRSMGSRRLNCTRCRSWSPALLDKLEDCMHHIRDKIPGFSNRDGNVLEGGDDDDDNDDYNRNLNQPKMEQHGDPLNVDTKQQPVLDDAESQLLRGTPLRHQLSSSSSSTSISVSEPIVDEEDEFNEVGLADWTRNMQRKTPLNCYVRSASRRQKLRQQLSGNSDTLSIQTAGTTLTNVSFDSSSNIPTTVLGSLENAVQNFVSSSDSTSASSSNVSNTKPRTTNNEQ